MFAFSIWDKRKNTLFIARDRYGIKPLYYAIVGNKFIFASEQKAIIKHPCFKSKLDKTALYEYMTFQNIYTDKTLLEGISMFPAGCYGTVSLGSNKIDISKYWDFDFTESDENISYEEYEEELLRLFKRAVYRQLISDVDVGSYLSGGMDSGSITAVAATQFPYLKTFTCGFDLNNASGMELNFDERRLAEQMSYLFKTEQYEVVLKAGDMERILSDLAWHLEEPRVGQSYPNYYIARLASKFVKVCLSGAGGDELFGGYPWRYYRAVNNKDFGEYISKYSSFWQRLLPSNDVSKVLNPIWDDVKDIQPNDIFVGMFNDSVKKANSPEEYVQASLYFEAKTFLHGLLVIEDKISMAHSLETRVPFLDNDLVDFAMKIPVKYKLNNLAEVSAISENEFEHKSAKYLNKTRDGKHILRKAMSRIVPNDITDAIKQGFSAPDATWFKGESIDYVNKLLLSKKSRIYDFLDFDETAKLINEHISGTSNRRLLIWSLLNLEHWFKHYL
jgi:asparagine synthase (glutamine-hydrolysing)